MFLLDWLNQNSCQLIDITRGGSKVNQDIIFCPHAGIKQVAIGQAVRVTMHHGQNSASSNLANFYVQAQLGWVYTSIRVSINPKSFHASSIRVRTYMILSCSYSYLSQWWWFCTRASSTRTFFLATTAARQLSWMSYYYYPSNQLGCKKELLLATN